MDERILELASRLSIAKKALAALERRAARLQQERDALAEKVDELRRRAIKAENDAQSAWIAAGEASKVPWLSNWAWIAISVIGGLAIIALSLLNKDGR